MINCRVLYIRGSKATLSNMNNKYSAESSDIIFKDVAQSSNQRIFIAFSRGHFRACLLQKRVGIDEQNNTHTHTHAQKSKSPKHCCCAFIKNDHMKAGLRRGQQPLFQKPFLSNQECVTSSAWHLIKENIDGAEFTASIKNGIIKTATEYSAHIFCTCRVLEAG